ncbi:MAG: MCE family protein [Bacteroidales bacterium]|nr:MCE family protein [Bacteroidales bacterium]
MKLSNEVRLGIIITIAIAIVIWGLNFLKGKNILKATNDYYAVYDQIGGLEVNSKVLMNGYRIGQVEDIYFNDDGSGNLTIVLGVHKSHKIPLGSVSEIFSADLLGTKAVQILLADNDEFYSDGDTLKSGFKFGLDQQLEEQLLPVKDKAEKLIVTIDSLLHNLQYVFDEETMNSLKESIKNLEESSENVSDMLAANSKLRAMIGHIESITRNLSENNKAISGAIQNFAAISDSLAQANLKATVEKTNLTLEQTHILLKKINDGEGTLGMLVNNDTLYRHIQDVSRDLDKLLIDLQENPKKYINVSVFGGKSDKKKK